MFKIKSETWGWLEASECKVSDRMVLLVDVTRDGKPFYPDCAIPLHDITLIVPERSGS